MKVIPGLFTLVFAATLICCKKEHTNPNPAPSPPSEHTPKILLKDIIIPNLPSPYYHFEYGPDSMVTKANFASGFNMYSVLYSNGRINEMRNDIIVNHDTLRYFYDDAGNVATIHFISENNELYRHVTFTYSNAHVTKVEWDHKAGNNFIIDRSVSFVYHQDGNLKELNEHRPAISGSPEINYTIHYDLYDDKINVDDFTLIHDGIHDHFLVLPKLHLMKNNPLKEMLTGGGNNYTATYTFTYKPDKTPVSKTGDVLFTSGSMAGQRFTTGVSYTYY